MKTNRNVRLAKAPRLAIKTVLVPTDLSDVSLRAISAAKRLAGKFGAEVHLANVQDYFSTAAFFAPALVPTVNPQKARALAQQQLMKLAREHGLSGECHAMLGGPPYRELSRLARSIRADLVVVPTHGHTGLKRALMGSTAERLVQHAPCPVFVARERKASATGKSSGPSGAASIRTILVPVDFSKCSAAGLKYAIAFAQQFGANIIVLHSIVPVVAMDAYAVPDISRYVEVSRKAAKQEMERFLNEASFSSVPFRSRIVDGFAPGRICAFAEDNGVDLIITSTHGRSGFKHLLIGSVAESVVRYANCPVLVVPSHPGVRITSAARGGQAGRNAAVPGVTRGRASRVSVPAALLTRRSRRQQRPPAPERRQTNKFRESHGKQPRSKSAQLTASK